MDNHIEIKKEGLTSVIALDHGFVIGRLEADKDGNEMSVQVAPLYESMRDGIVDGMKQRAHEWGILR